MYASFTKGSKAEGKIEWALKIFWTSTILLRNCMPLSPSPTAFMTIRVAVITLASHKGAVVTVKVSESFLICNSSAFALYFVRD